MYLVEVVKEVYYENVKSMSQRGVCDGDQFE